MIVVEIEEGLTVRFPHRSDAFAEGVEIGLLLAEAATSPPSITRLISPAALEQAMRVFDTFCYPQVTHTMEEDGRIRVSASRGQPRPRLRVVK